MEFIKNHIWSFLILFVDILILSYNLNNIIQCILLLLTIYFAYTLGRINSNENNNNNHFAH